MKTTGMETYSLKSPLERPFGWSQGWIDQRADVVQVTTDQAESWDGARALVREPFGQVGGFLAVPTGPGPGIEIDETALARIAAD